MRFTKWLLSLQALSLLVAIGFAQDVHYNYARGTNFSSYKTYQWVDLPNRVPDQLVDRDIKSAVDEELAQKGLTKVESGGDLLVGYQAMIMLEKGINLNGFGMRDPGPGGWGGWDSGTVTGETSTIPVGTLLVSIYDPGKKQLIWRGDASKSVDLKKDPEKNYKNLQKAMAKLFKNYPPNGK